MRVGDLAEARLRRRRRGDRLLGMLERERVGLVEPDLGAQGQVLLSRLGERQAGRRANAVTAERYLALFAVGAIAVDPVGFGFVDDAKVEAAAVAVASRLFQGRREASADELSRDPVRLRWCPPNRPLSMFLSTGKGQHDAHAVTHKLIPV
jgi:hypothetical protein